VELEFQVIDQSTLDLTGASAEILTHMGPQPWLQPELLHGMLEVNSMPRENVRAAGDDLLFALRSVRKTAEQFDAALACAGTHPTAKHWEREPHPLARYRDLIDRNQFVARRLMIFGMHVHLGVESGELCIGLLNEMLHELPMFLALSGSSPFWESIDTGMASARSTIFEAIPTGGHPCQIRDWNEFQTLAETLIRVKAIRNVKDIWWDARPSPGYGTLEIRVCDSLPTLRENLALAAFIHASAFECYARLKAGKPRALLPDWMVRENKWRAARHGIEADLVDEEHGSVLPLMDALRRRLAILEPHFARLEYEDYRETIERALGGYTSYSRQKAIYAKTGRLKEVTRFLIDEMDRSL